MTKPKRNSIAEVILDEIEADEASDLSLTSIKQNLVEWGIEPSMPPDFKALVENAFPNSRLSAAIRKATPMADDKAPELDRVNASSKAAEDRKKAVRRRKSSAFVDADMQQSAKSLQKSRDRINKN